MGEQCSRGALPARGKRTVEEQSVSSGQMMQCQAGEGEHLSRPVSPEAFGERGRRGGNNG